MGRTTPSYIQQIAQVTAQWSPFRRSLPREDRPHFDKLFHSVRQYSPSGMYQCHDNPMETILLSMCLDLEKRIYALEHPGEGKQDQPGDEGRLPFPASDVVSADED